ncbi:hypothetical protein SAMN06265222_12812 [Neorhodopirellula lusitana]|uniref:Uncharacterized protein n=1 Tax=Neorhodopirellula lusitana TaxID=445327 RepID=A0ABY1QVA8_9BACT|nr:hypothetical protein SAMN06265222_12812 [Neorhodopirellula lusitana]
MQVSGKGVRAKQAWEVSFALSHLFLIERRAVGFQGTDLLSSIGRSELHVPKTAYEPLSATENQGAMIPGQAALTMAE